MKRYPAGSPVKFKFHVLDKNDKYVAPIKDGRGVDKLYLRIKNISRDEVLVEEQFNDSDNWFKETTGRYLFVWQTDRDYPRGEYEVKCWAYFRNVPYENRTYDTVMRERVILEDEKI